MSYKLIDEIMNPKVNYCSYKMVIEGKSARYENGFQHGTVKYSSVNDSPIYYNCYYDKDGPYLMYMTGGS